MSSRPGWVVIFFSLPALTALVALTWLVSIPSGGTGWLGFSASRLALAGFFLVSAMGFSALTGFIWLQGGWVVSWLDEKLEYCALPILVACGVIFVATACLLLLPAGSMENYSAIYIRIQPLLAWLCATGFQGSAGLLIWLAPRQGVRLRENVPLRKTLWASGFVLAVFISIWFFIALTQLGIGVSEDYWSKPGAPILWPQFLAALLVALVAAFLLPEKKWAEALLVILIVLVAGVLWMRQAYLPGAFNSPARPPTFEIFPINDAQIFDSAAQKLLNGQRMIFDVIDKPLYIAQLALLHLLAGTSYNAFYLLQVLFYTSIPVCGYFLGKTLHSRALGLVFAALLVVHETNAIALTNYLSVSTSKMILSEPFTTLGVLLFTIVLARWLKQPASMPTLWAAGGILGLAGLVRLNSVTILPAAVLLIGLTVKFRLKRWLLLSATLSAFALLSFSPWMVRTWVVSGNPLSFISAKTSGVIVNQRYQPVIQNEATVTEPETSRLASYLTLGRKILKHYLHNLVSITILLPPTPVQYNLFGMIRQPFWKLEWDGQLTLPQAISLFGVLAVAALGLGAAWTRQATAGLAPLVVALGYNLSTAISLTSGGRYLVPFDWCLVFYFSLGLMEILRWVWILLKEPASTPGVESFPPAPASRLNGRQLSLAVSACLLLGLLPVLVEWLPAQRYPQQVTFADFTAQNRTLLTADAQAALASLARDPAARVFYGQILYPRYFASDESDNPDMLSPLLGPLPVDRVTFYLSALVSAQVILPISAIPPASLSGASAWVVGCQRENYVEAVMVIPTGQTYSQVPLKQNCE